MRGTLQQWQQCQQWPLEEFLTNGRMWNDKKLDQEVLNFAIDAPDPLKYTLRAKVFGLFQICVLLKQTVCLGQDWAYQDQAVRTDITSGNKSSQN